MPQSYDREAMPDARREGDPHFGQLVEEQAALRRVATLVARGVSSAELFEAVSGEVARLFGSEAGVARFEPDGSALVLVGLSEGIRGIPIGTRWELESFLASSEVYRTRRPARSEPSGLQGVSGPIADALRENDLHTTVSAPIVAGGRPWGVIAVSGTNDTLPPDAEARLEKFTELVATAIVNAESRDALSELLEEQAALRRVATLVARGAGPDELFSAVSGEVGRLFGSDQAAVARYDSDGTGMVVVGATAGIQGVSVGTHWPLEEFLASTVVHQTGRTARSDHTGHRDASGPVADSLRQMDAVSTVAAPIVVEDRVWGVMTVSDMGRPLPADSEQRLEKFTELVGTAIANAESRAELSASEDRAHGLAREQAALRRVATLVAEGPNTDELFAAVTREVADVVDIPVVGLLRFEEDATVTMVGIAGETSFTVGSRWPVEDEALAGVILATGRPARREDYATMPGPVGTAVRSDGMTTTVGVPIVVEGSIWGFIVAAVRPGGAIPERTEERLARFTELVAIAIANGQAREHLAQLANEQAALRRVATLVARESSRLEIVGAVTAEAMHVVGTTVGLLRFEADDTATLVAQSETPWPPPPLGTRFRLDGENLVTTLHRTGYTTRLDDWTNATGDVSAMADVLGVRSSVAAPIVVEGRLWGTLVATTNEPEPLPPDTEGRLLTFAELVATAIANTESRAELAASEARARGLAVEQAALRRVATLVAEGANPDRVFSAVAEAIEEVLGIPVVTICRCEPDGFLVIRSSGMPGFPAGSRWPWDVPSLPGLIYQTGRPARIDDFTDAVGLNAAARDAGVKAAVGVPIVIGGTVWGSICAATTEDEALPPDLEERLGRFRQLVATSVSNTIMREELAASRARVIAATDDARRRIERDLHDGAQQRLVTLAIALRRAEAKIPAQLEAVRAEVARVGDGLATAVEELQELSRGIHPSILTEGGLSPALKALGRRSAVRVKLDVGFERRLPDHLEVAAYYTVSEALTNAAKHAGAMRVWIALRLEEAVLVLSIRDDGAGGADPSRGSGLTGLRDRIEALGGTIRIVSPLGGGTDIDVQIPLGASPFERQSERIVVSDAAP
jgi:GAF domain-containing protein